MAAAWQRKTYRDPDTELALEIEAMRAILPAKIDAVVDSFRHDRLDVTPRTVTSTAKTEEPLTQSSPLAMHERWSVRLLLLGLLFSAAVVWRVGDMSSNKDTDTVGVVATQSPVIDSTSPAPESPKVKVMADKPAAKVKAGHAGKAHPPQTGSKHRSKEALAPLQPLHFEH